MNEIVSLPWWQLWLIIVLAIIVGVIGTIRFKNND